MENLLANANRRGANAFGDEARRLPTRPQAPASTHGSQTTRRKGKAVEDLGSGFLGAGALGEKRKAKAIMKRPPIRKSQRHDDLDSESGDDMDLLSSQGDNGSDAGTFVQNNPKGKEKEQERGVWDKSGKFHEYHHNYQPKKTTLPKGLSFKKNKTIPSGAPTSVLPDAYSTATPPVLQEHGTNRSRLSASFRGSPTPQKPTSQTSNGCAQSSGSPSVYNNKPTTSKSITLAHSSKPARDPQTSENNRPKPRPLRRAVSTQHKPQPIPDVGASDNDTPRSSARRNTVTEPRPFPLLLPDYENVDPRRSSPVEKLYHAAFPLLSPVASPARAAKCPSLTPLALEEKTATVKKPSYQVPRGNGTITQVLPTTHKPVKGKDECAFPRPSPLSANKEIAGKPKSKQKRYPRPTYESQEHDSDIEESQNSSEHPRAQPFPMSTQVLNSIGSQDASPTAGPSRLGKRSSSDGSDNERNRKRTKQDENTEYIPLDDYDYDENDDTLMISPSTDPRTLCPYCDSLLPASPTALLERLLLATEKKSSHDPRPMNPLGRKAPFAVFIAVCQRHRFESEILPEAERKGWPKEIEWRKIGERVSRMRKRLRALIDDTGEDGNDDNRGEVGGEDILFTVEEKAKKRERGSRSKCVFWREVVAEVKKKGSRAVAGVRGQFASFEKTQPGYYGELGSVIIHQTLYDLFPPASIDPSSISPLTVNEFIQRILVPEVGVRLIMEDQGLEREEGMETAVSILRESASYGVAMFPEDGDEWDVGSGGGDGRRGQKGVDGDGDEMGVADRIVMERARKRRKELEEEDGGTELEMEMETETEMGEVQIVSDMGTEDERRTKPKSQRKRSELTKNEKGKAKEIDTMPIIAPRPKPRPLGKTSSSASVLVDDLDTGKTRSTTAITRGTTYLNLCPTTDDDEESQDRKDTGKKTKQRRKKSAMLATKRQAPEPVSEERDTDEDTVDMMATPIAKHTRHLPVDNIDDLEETPRISGRSPVSWTPYTTNSPFLPLKAARQRRGNRSETASDVHPPTSESASRNKDSAWLLSDSSQGSSEGM